MGIYKVLIPQDIAEEGKEYLREKGYEVKMGSGSGIDAIKKDVVDCDAILARTTLFPAEVLKAGKKLKVISRHGVGVDNIDVETATKLGIYVTNARESNSNTVAELTLGFIIALARNMLICDHAMRANNFGIRNHLNLIDLEGKTLALLGLGKIGRLVALKAHYGLSMKVIAYDPHLKTENFPKEVQKVEQKDRIFQEGDFVSIHMPSLAETKQSIGKHEFEMMKKSAFFINVARGDLIKEAELVFALKNNLIAGAALDVFDREPPAENNPLFSLDNVIMTPHNAALTRECMIRMAVHAAQGIHEVLSGQDPTWPVNKPGR